MVYLWFILLVLAAASLLLVIWAAWRKRPQLPGLVAAATVAWTALVVFTMFIFAWFIPLNYGLVALFLTVLVTMLALLQWGWSRATVTGAVAILALAVTGSVLLWAEHSLHPRAVGIHALYRPAIRHNFSHGSIPDLPLPPNTIFGARTSQTHAFYWTTTDPGNLADFFRAVADDGRVETDTEGTPQIRYKLHFTYQGHGMEVAVYDWSDPRVVQFGVDLNRTDSSSASP